MMKKTLVLDGYNVIHAVPALEKTLRTSLEASRNALIDYCRQFQSRRGDIAKVIIFFDGKRAPLDLPETFSQRGSEIEIFFSEEGQDADDQMLEWMEEQDARSLIAVSSDNHVINNTRAQGISILSAAEFRAAVEKQNAKKTQLQPAQTLSRAEAEAITEEYKIFLKTKA
jgi:predicted RNA-binding protein with PIN domain